ncbi:putative signal peptide protein [Puccinia sorghi]|uniref:Putative signal peptide protein n=1 Tax=Puccinia sorghi TaxID=27349 RepID=A0A0L6V2E1_9BASI|nr:putative signal peptide protein [Puccinia sorghi]
MLVIHNSNLHLFFLWCICVDRIKNCSIFNVFPDAPNYINYFNLTMQHWEIAHFTMDWEKHYNEQSKQIICQFFLCKQLNCKWMSLT